MSSPHRSSSTPHSLDRTKISRSIRDRSSATAKCWSARAWTLLFAPSVEEMYPAGAVTWVTVEGLSEKLDGRSRPGHFRGVTTVVAKLFHVVEPDAAFFGQKDAAQVAIIRRMVRDLNLAGGDCGLPDRARGRRPGHEFAERLSRSEQRKQALVLHRSLMRVQNLAEAGEREVAKIAGGGARGSCRGKFSAPGLLRDRRSEHARSSQTCDIGNTSRDRRVCRQYAPDRQHSAGRLKIARLAGVSGST